MLEEEHVRLTDASQQIEKLAFFDMVTGLPNRKLFLDRLKQFVERGARTQQAAALAFLDIDHFKRVNDSYGHDVGDQVLAAIADRLLHSVREGDLVGRLGGDEFTILMPGIGSVAEASEAARHLLERLRAPMLVGDHGLSVAASVGISLFPADGEDPTSLLRKADIAMYRAKDSGRNRAVAYDEAMSQSSRERHALELSLRSGELLRQLVLHYQPIVRSGSGEITGAEALIRWQHPERGLLSPMEFLPIAEASGTAEAISDWVLHAACRQAADWRRLFHEHFRISVNLTARAFESPRLLPAIDEILSESGLPAHALELEITETMALLSGGEPIATLNRLRERGVRVAVDDFGIGYSSLSYLRELPIETVKLDSSFIRDLGRRPEDSRIVGAVIQLAHGLGMEVVAEGVEHEEQMAVLELLYCDKMQGFLFSRPLQPERFEELMDAARPFLAARAPSRGPAG
jgi:diguanylate cyclase (GGDEF)-like protein